MSSFAYFYLYFDVMWCGVHATNCVCMLDVLKPPLTLLFRETCHREQNKTKRITDKPLQLVIGINISNKKIINHTLSRTWGGLFIIDKLPGGNSISVGLFYSLKVCVYEMHVQIIWLCTGTTVKPISICVGTQMVNALVVVAHFILYVNWDMHC